ncbi:hypothetical protein [Streptomyces griseosporeus]|uniref:effector-associated domain 2-containing protein n=1 Tax=Streptomyces griseosporeus TaxID=1910 RepID=UPI0036FFB1AC
MQEPVARGALAEVVEILVVLDGFRDDPVRAVITDELGLRVSSRIPRHLSVPQQVHAIVQTCLRVPGGLAPPADVLTAFHGTTARWSGAGSSSRRCSFPRSCGTMSGAS